MSELIEVMKTDAIAQITLNRPEAYNAFDYNLVSQLASRLTTLAGDDSVSGVVVTGRGKAFCAGGDLKWATWISGKTGGRFSHPGVPISPGGPGDPQDEKAGAGSRQRRRRRRWVFSGTGM